MPDDRQSSPRPPSISSPCRRRAAGGARSDRIAARVECFSQHLRRVSFNLGSPIDPPENPGMVEILDLLEDIGVEPIHFFAELLQLWRADPRLWPADEQAEEEG